MGRREYVSLTKKIVEAIEQAEAQEMAQLRRMEIRKAYKEGRPIELVIGSGAEIYYKQYAQKWEEFIKAQKEGNFQQIAQAWDQLYPYFKAHFFDKDKWKEARRLLEERIENDLPPELTATEMLDLMGGDWDLEHHYLIALWLKRWEAFDRFAEELVKAPAIDIVEEITEGLENPELLDYEKLVYYFQLIRNREGIVPFGNQIYWVRDEIAKQVEIDSKERFNYFLAICIYERGLHNLEELKNIGLEKGG